MVQNMTRGAPWKLIVLFAVPLLLGNVFQAAYNLADTIIVGRFVGPEALAGVGVASPVFNLFNGLLIGLSVGSSIMVAQLFGGGKRKELSRAVTTVLWTSLWMAVVLTLLSQLLVEPLLQVLQTPAADFPYARVYLRTTLCGLVCSVFYNQLSGLLRGVGNARTPLYFLIFASVLNAMLDLLFVGAFGMGVMGAGLATVAAEGISALLTARYILRKVPELHPRRDAGGFDREMFRDTLRFGLPMGLQQASISLGHILLQGIINPFGTALIAGYAAAAKVDMFAVMPIISLSTAVSTFTAQNIGAGERDRVKQGYHTALWMTAGVCLALTAAVVPLRGGLMSLFVSAADYPELAPQVMAAGMSMLAVTPLFYVVLGMIHTTLNTMAGAGDTGYSMFAMIFMMFARVALAFAFLRLLPGLGYTGIWWAFPASWGLTLVLVLCHYARGNWMKKAMGQRPNAKGDA